MKLDDAFKCPKCGGKVAITKIVCFGMDPHREYRCVGNQEADQISACLWRGRYPGLGYEMGN